MPNINSSYGPGHALTTTADPANPSGMDLMQALIADRQVDYGARRANAPNERPYGAGMGSAYRQAAPRHATRPIMLGAAQAANDPNAGSADEYEPTFGTISPGSPGVVGGGYGAYVPGSGAGANAIVATGYKRRGSGPASAAVAGGGSALPGRPTPGTYERNQAWLDSDLS